MTTSASHAPPKLCPDTKTVEPSGLVGSAHALSVPEMLTLFAEAGLPEPQVETLRMAGDLNSLLARSYCVPGDEARCRQLYEDSLVDDRIDMQPRREGDNILYAFPVAIYGSVLSS